MNFALLFTSFLCGVLSSDVAQETMHEESMNSIWICEVGNAEFLGEYVTTAETRMDGVQFYTNEHDNSIYRSKGFWYIGDLGPWPPQTHYRCVDIEGCTYEEPTPPLEGKWVAKKNVGVEPLPVLSATPCGDRDEL